MAESRILLGIVASAIVATASVAQQKAEAPAPRPIPRAQFIASMDAEFRTIDADKNGQVTRAEIEGYELLKAEVAAKARNRAQFVELDTNKNGQLSPAEFAKMVTPPVVSAEPTLARMDSNRDSQVSLAEYRAAALANFDRLDSDRNGIVTSVELEAGGIRPH